MHYIFRLTLASRTISIIYFYSFKTTLECSKIQVLWIGNSYTYVNDVPKTTQGLSYNDGIPHHIEYDQHTEGGWTWEDHSESKVFCFRNLTI